MYWNMRPQHNLCYYTITRQDITTSVLYIGFFRLVSLGNKVPVEPLPMCIKIQTLSRYLPVRLCLS